jgi:hypothetical protein
MNAIKYIIFIIIGILIFFILNNSETFSIGVTWIIVDESIPEISIPQLSGEAFYCNTDDSGNFIDVGDGETCFKKFSDVLEKIEEIDEIEPDIYHIVRDIDPELGIEPGYYRLDLENMCGNPHKKMGGTNTAQATTEWQRKTKENSETKPLMPRKNLKISDSQTDISIGSEMNKRFNSLDTISYRCDTEKTQSKPGHTIICKPRKKFFLNAHGGISEPRDLDHKTSIPQLFQLKLYKPQNDQCVETRDIDDHNIVNSIIRGTDEITPSGFIGTDGSEHNIQSNKIYLAILDLIQLKENMPLEELVYSELSKLNSGRLYLNSNYESQRLSSKLLNSKLDRLYFADDTNVNNMYCFCSDMESRIVACELLEANLVFFLNPFLVQPIVLYDNVDTMNLDILQLKRAYTLYATFTSTARRVFPIEIYPNGVNSEDLTIIKVGEPNLFESPYLEGNQWDVLDPSQMNDEIIRLSRQASARQVLKYNLLEVSEAIPGEPGTYTRIFTDGKGTLKPVYLYKLQVTYEARLVVYLKQQVKDLLLSCCVNIDPSLLRSAFRSQPSFQRLFPSETSRDFPLLYFDLYANNGFVHLDNDSSLDTQNGEYTSSDLRDLTTEIINQIYEGVDLDHVDVMGIDAPVESALVLAEYGYYQMFKTKMMLEKGFNDTDTLQMLFNLYGNIPEAFRRTFILSSIKYNIKNKYLCVRLLQEVWGQYGYDYYNTENLDMYKYSADLPIILAKLFKTEIGESVDFHLLCCIRTENTDVRSIQKNGYWKCNDDVTWREDDTNNTCDFYNQESVGRTSIEKCRETGHNGANDNCCICKMVKNMDEDGNENGKPNIGPECKVKECKETYDEKNADLSNVDMGMGIKEDDWTTTNTWPEYPNPPGRTEGPGIGDYLPRKMEHVETAYKYVSNLTNPDGSDNLDYGSIQLIKELDDDIDGVLRETESIRVLCTSVNPSGDIGSYPAFAATVAGDIKCDLKLDSDSDSDEAQYTDDLNCPTELPQISLYHMGYVDPIDTSYWTNSCASMVSL